MKQKLKRLFTVVMALIAFGSFAIPVSAYDIATYASAYISSYSSGVVSRGTTIYVDYTITANGTQEQVGVYYIAAHQLQDDGTWKLQETTYHSDSNNFVALDTNFHAGTFEYEGEAGNTYRFAIQVFAGGEDGSDARSFYTQNITI